MPRKSLRTSLICLCFVQVLSFGIETFAWVRTCDANFSPKPVPFGAKNFVPPELTPSDLIPPSILELLKDREIRIEPYYGTVRMSDPRMRLSIDVSFQDPANPRSKRRLMKATLIQSENNGIEVDGLVLDSPRAEPTRANDPDHQGWSMAETMWAFRNLQALATRFGAKRILAQGSETYAASLLYRRFGLVPVDADSRRVYDLFDAKFEEAKKYMAPEFRPKSAREFDLFINPTGYVEAEAAALLKIALENPETRMNSVLLHRNGEGEVFAATFHGLGIDANESLTRLLNPSRDPRVPFLIWWHERQSGAALAFE